MLLHDKLQDRHHIHLCISLYQVHGEKSHTLPPCAVPSNRYASTITVLSYIPLQSFSYSVPRSVGSNNHTITFSAAKLFELVDTGKRGCNGTHQ